MVVMLFKRPVAIVLVTQAVSTEATSSDTGAHGYQPTMLINLDITFEFYYRLQINTNTSKTKAP